MEGIALKNMSSLLKQRLESSKIEAAIQERVEVVNVHDLRQTSLETGLLVFHQIHVSQKVTAHNS